MCKIGYPEVMKWLIACLLALLMVPAFGQYNKPVTPEQEAKNIKLLLSKQAVAKKTYLKKKSDVKAKKAYVDSTVALGLQYTYANTVDRKKKYKIALNYFREALKTDPKNSVATEWKTRIEDIYRSMGRPIPH